MRSVEWRGKVFHLSEEGIRSVECCGNVGHLICGGQCVGEVAWKRVSLYPRKPMRLVEWRVKVVPFTCEGQCVR